MNDTDQQKADMHTIKTAYVASIANVKEKM